MRISTQNIARETERERELGGGLAKGRKMLRKVGFCDIKNIYIKGGGGGCLAKWRNMLRQVAFSYINNAPHLCLWMEVGGPAMLCPDV